MSPKLSASLMCANLVNLERDIQLLEENGVDYLHIDGCHIRSQSDIRP